MKPNDLSSTSPGQCIEVRTPRGERAFAFLPDLLPSSYKPSAQALRLNERAAAALGGTSVLGAILPDPTLLLGSFVRAEAVSSTKIEGTRADFEDLIIDEAGVAGVDDDLASDVEEVRNYLDATSYGWNKPEDRPLSSGYIRDLHTILLQGVRGQDRSPGAFRDHLVHIGRRQETIVNARFVPPPPEQLPGLVENLIEYMREDAPLPDLIRLAIIHYQFETIHPFSDGNGRLGRLLMPLLLKEWGYLENPTLPLSEYFEFHRDTYIDLLFAVSTDGVWDEWVCFVLEAIKIQADTTVRRTRNIVQLRERMRAQYQATRVGKILMVIDALFERPAITVNQVAEKADLGYSAANKIVGRLVEDGILVEWTGRPRDRVFIAVDIADAVLGREPGYRPSPRTARDNR